MTCKKFTKLPLRDPDLSTQKINMILTNGAHLSLVDITEIICTISGFITCSFVVSFQVN